MVIDHHPPYFISDTHRGRMYFRNGLIYHLMTNNIQWYFIFFMQSLYQSLFFLFFLGKAGMLRAYLSALSDFVSGNGAVECPARGLLENAARAHHNGHRHLR